MAVVLPSLIALGGLGVAFGVGLAIASKAFAVSTDPRIDSVLEALPGANCGACGYAGCAAYAENIVAKGVSISDCSAGGLKTANAIAAIMGVAAETKAKRVAVVHCQGGMVSARFGYQGVQDCRAAALLQGGFKSCEYGCLGLGSCVEACPFGGIEMVNGLPRIDEERCVGCGQCVLACPRGIIKIHPASATVQVLCRSVEKGGVVRKICERGCIACKKCEKTCEAGAVTVVNFLAEVDSAKCTVCGKCVSECPTKAIVTRVG